MIELFTAIRDEDHATVRRLLNADPALRTATNPKNFGATVFNTAVGARSIAMIDTLHSLGADIDQGSSWEMGAWTPLQLALNHGDDTIAKHLVKCGATVGPHGAAGLGRVEALRAEDVNTPGGDGCLPLHFAKNEDVVERLIALGADIDARDKDHQSTAAQYLCRVRPEATRALHARGAQADVFSAAAADDHATLDQLLANDPTCLDAVISKKTLPTKGRKILNILHFTIGTGCNALHAAAVGDAPKMIERLIGLRLDPQTRAGYDDATPLHMAAWNNACGAAAALIDAGVDINVRSGKIHDNTPLGWALVAGKVEMCELLIARGAEITPWLERDARSGIAGEFRSYVWAPRENYEQILALLVNTST